MRCHLILWGIPSNFIFQNTLKDMTNILGVSWYQTINKYWYFSDGIFISILTYIRFTPLFKEYIFGAETLCVSWSWPDRTDSLNSFSLFCSPSLLSDTLSRSSKGDLISTQSWWIFRFWFSTNTSVFMCRSSDESVTKKFVLVIDFQITLEVMPNAHIDPFTTVSSFLFLHLLVFGPSTFFC